MRTTISHRVDRLAAQGGPAFPTYLTPLNASGAVMAGMSMRDWFAGVALCSVVREGNEFRNVAAIAEHAYLIADALMAERDK